jgi:hypothetical protein
MELLSRYKIVIAVVLPILILVLIRTLGPDQFKSDAKSLAEPSVMRSNIIMADKIDALAGEKLIINLSDALIIPADSILLRNNLNNVRRHNGPVLLFSTDIAVSARVWMVLSQMGYKNIYILCNDADNEIFKSKFRPDTNIRPEPEAL